MGDSLTNNHEKIRGYLLGLCSSRDLPTGIMCDFVDIDIDTITLKKCCWPWQIQGDKHMNLRDLRP
jgi:hypothetical protein